MRPRGLSRSSPSNTNVGQVAVQNPQCTHLRRICSLRAVSGSVSWARVKLVCIRSENLRRVTHIYSFGRLLDSLAGLCGSLFEVIERLQIHPRLGTHAQGAFEP